MTDGEETHSMKSLSEYHNGFNFKLFAIYFTTVDSD